MEAHKRGFPAKQSSPWEKYNSFAGENHARHVKGGTSSNVDNQADESVDANPERALIAKQDQALIKNCVIDHPVECRYYSYVEMKFLEGKSYGDIAKQFSVSRQDAIDRIRSTMKFIQKYVRTANG